MVDYEGQKLADNISTYIITIAAVCHHQLTGAQSRVLHPTIYALLLACS
jgi:hypothetical protein